MVLFFLCSTDCRDTLTARFEGWSHERRIVPEFTTLSASHTDLPELTLRGLVLGALITVVFTAANVYLGLKVGLTFASSIPAAVISMAVLRVLGGANILENNMVQDAGLLLPARCPR